MCDIYHHLQHCVWKAGPVVVVLCAMCLLSYVQASPALTRLQFQDAERLWMSIHQFSGDFLVAGRPRISLFLSISSRSSLSVICHLSLLAFHFLFMEQT